MRIAAFNENLPDWIKEELPTICPYCGGYLIDNEELTLRKCSNSQCPGHISQKMDRLLKGLGVKNFGPATALDYIRQFKLTNHLQIIPYVFKEKPKVPLYKVGEYAMLYGVDKVWQSLVKGFASMDEFLKSPRCPQGIRLNGDYLKYAETFFEVDAPLKGTVLNVMLSGSIDGFNNRRDFIDAVNATFGDRVQLIDVGKRKSNVDYLIKEPWTVDHEKSNLAMRNGIPILSSKELLEKIAAHIAYIIEKEEKEKKENFCEVSLNED